MTAARSSPARRRGPVAGERYLLPGVLALIAGLALFVYFFRLGVPSWRGDEIDYRDSGQAYWAGEFTRNVENTFLAKYILGQFADVFGSGRLAVRIPTATAGLLTGGFLALLARRVGGWWAAAIVLALWCLLPRPSLIGPFEVEQIKIERFARLDVYMGMFVAASLFCGWRWIESGRWRWALAAGVSVGLATASKAPGVLTLVPVLAAGLLGLGLTRRSLGQAAGAAGAALLALGITYLPAGTATPGLIGDMIDAQRAHALFGHRMVFDGKIYDAAPWWGNLWWQWKSLGTVSTISVVATVLIAPFVLRRELAVLLLGAVLVPLGFFMFRLEYALPHYYYDWQPALIATAGLVLYKLAAARPPTRIVAAAFAIPLAVTAIGTIVDVARLEPRDYAAVDRELGSQLRSGTVVGPFSTELLVNLPGLRLTTNPTGVRDLAGVIDDRSLSIRGPNTRIAAYIRAHRSDLTLHRFGFVDVYVPRSAAARARIGAQSGARDPTRPKAEVIRGCLIRAGLVARLKSRTAESTTLDVRLPNAVKAVVTVEQSPSAAAVTTATIGRFVDPVGGSARRIGDVAVGYAGRATAADARRLESCVTGREP